jgi:hypothetical protein
LVPPDAPPPPPAKIRWLFGKPRPTVGRSAPRRSRRADPRYRRLWLGDWRRIFVENGAAASSKVALIVSTAPGAAPPPGEPYLPGVNCLPWDLSKCTHLPGTPHSGKHGCQVQAAALDTWNRSAPARWSALHRAAATRVRRKMGSFGQVFQAWEPQLRGALHQNVVVACGTAHEMRCAALYRDALADLAPRYGFGFVDRKRAVRESLHAARYLAKYLSEDTGKMGMGDLAARGDCPRSIARVNRELTQATGATMRACRRRRANWNLATRLAPLTPDGCSIEEAEAVRSRIERRRAAIAMHNRARRRRWAHGLGINEMVDAQHAAREADLRWSHFLVAQAGLQPEPLD